MDTFICVSFHSLYSNNPVSLPGPQKAEGDIRVIRGELHFFLSTSDSSLGGTTEGFLNSPN